MNNISRKKLLVSLFIIVLLSSAFIINFHARASIDQLLIAPVPIFSGQMYSSTFASNGRLFVGDNNYTLYRSDDGSSFRLIYQFPKQSNPSSMVTGFVWNIFVDSRNSLFVFIPDTNRLYRSTLYVNITKSGLNHLQAAISKVSLPQVSPLKVYINNVQENYTYVETADSWAVTIMAP